MSAVVRESRGPAWGAALLVAVLAAVPTVPRAGLSEALWPDAVEFLAIANSWVHGAGFVDPIKWTYYLDVTAPFPAFALRPPVPPLLFALPLALGGSVAAVKAFHALLGSLVAGSVVLLARRTMRLPAAVACGLLIGLSPAWTHLALMPLSDLPAIGALLGVLATAPGTTRSARGALACVLATLLGWTTRPNLLLLVGAIVLCAVWAQGVRASWRSRPLRIYLGGVVAGYALIHWLTVLVTGFAPYQGYGFMMEMLSDLSALSYQKEYVGAVTFVWRHLGAVLGAIGRNAVELVWYLFASPPFGYVGWIALPGSVYCVLFARGDAERVARLRLAGLATWIFAAQAVLTYGAFDAYRYPLPTVVCGALCGFAWLDDLMRRSKERACAPQRPRAVAAASGALALVPLVAAVALLVQLGGTKMLRSAVPQWQAFLTDAPRPVAKAGSELGELCRSMRRGMLVAAADPWSVHALCGNPAITLPRDLTRLPELRQKFLANERPRYVVRDAAPQRAWIARSPLLKRVAANGRFALYEVRWAEPRPAAWIGAPPLRCAGRGEECLEKVGRRAARTGPLPPAPDVAAESVIRGAAMASVTIRPLRPAELDEADRIFRLAFGTFIGLPDPRTFAGDSDYVRTRFAAVPEGALAAELDGELVGTNFALRRGSLAFFGPLSVRPELQNRGIAQELLAATMDVFARWGVEHAGLFTFPNSPKHVALYQKFGFWPGHLMAIMGAPVGAGVPADGTAVLAELGPDERAAALAGCRAIASELQDGLDPTAEIEAIGRLGLGDVVVVRDGGEVQAFALCHCGAGTEAQGSVCFAKFGMVRPRAGAAAFDRLLDGCAALAARRSLPTLQVGVSTASRAAYRRLIARGFRTELLGVEMHRPEGPAYHRPDAFVLDDWR